METKFRSVLGLTQNYQDHLQNSIKLLRNGASEGVNLSRTWTAQERRWSFSGLVNGSD